MKNLIPVLLLFSLTSCGFFKSTPDFEKKYSVNDHQNQEKFEKHLMRMHDSLGSVYHLKEHIFDVQCIRKKEDFTNLVITLVDSLGGFKIQKIKDGKDKEYAEYFTILTINGSNYEFYTPSDDEYVDVEELLFALDDITIDQSIDYEYQLSNIDHGRSIGIIFGNSDDISNAINKGYPCFTYDSEWYWEEGTWQNGLYSDIVLSELSDYDELKKKYLANLDEQIQKGGIIPELTLERMYVDDIYQDNEIDIAVDGSIVTSGAIFKNKIRCGWNSWDIMLAYTLIKDFNGIPEFYHKDSKYTSKISREEYMKMAEKAFMK